MKKKIIIFAAIIFAIVVLFGLFTPKKEKEIQLNVVSTTPKNNAVFVDTKAEITLTLSRIVSVEEGNNLKTQIKPEGKTSIVYQEDKIRISPEEPFRFDTKYEISIIYKDKNIYTLAFTTTPFTQQQIEEEGLKQTAGDIAFTEAYKQFLTKYPWYTRLPIENFEYRIVYDFEKESFRIRLKIPTETEDQEKTLINKALSDLKKIGVKEPVSYYTIKHESQP